MEVGIFEGAILEDDAIADDEFVVVVVIDFLGLEMGRREGERGWGESGGGGGGDYGE